METLDVGDPRELPTNYIFGSDEGETITGTKRRDVIYAGGGDDIINYVDEDMDKVDGGDDFDTINWSNSTKRTILDGFKQGGEAFLSFVASLIPSSADPLVRARSNRVDLFLKSANADDPDLGVASHIEAVETSAFR